MLIFNFFKLEEKYHHKVLFWGILGAVVSRAVFIGAGSYIISQFHFMLYIFGALLLYTGVKLFTDKKEEHVDFENNVVVRYARKYLRFTTGHHNGKFILWENGKLHFTLLFLIVMIVETTDIVFAIDSIPAAFAISQNSFIVFTSNIFAVMGLRALFFLIESFLHRFHHLQKGLAFILIFIGIKMLIGIFGIHISSLVSLAIIMSALGLSLWLSVLFPKKI
jgi:tellurite resistance protein TerC